MLCEAPTGGAFDRKTGNTVGNLTKILLKSQMPRDLPLRIKKNCESLVLQLSSFLTSLFLPHVYCCYDHISNIQDVRSIYS